MRTHFTIVSMLLSLAISLMTPSQTSAAPLLVDNGKPNAQIVTASNPPRTVTIAAEELQTYIEKISGAKLPIVHQPSADGSIPIYVGQSSYTDKLGLSTEGLNYGAYRMASGKNWFALLGADKDFSLKQPWPASRNGYDAFYEAWDKITGEHFDNPLVAMWRKVDQRPNGTGMFEQDLDNAGTFFAVNRFLRDLGARWYTPGDLGEILPVKKTIELPNLNLTKHPDFGLRNLYLFGSNFFGGNKERIMWQMRIGANQGYELLGITTNTSTAHGSSHLLRREEAKKEHPEYFATRGGEPILYSLLGKKTGTGIPCLVNKGLMHANVRYLQKMFDTYDLPALAVGPTDGFTFLCECEPAQAFAAPHRGWKGTMSNYTWNYIINVANELAKTHPNKKINALAYSTYMKPPENVDKLPSNIIVGIAQSRVHFIDPDARQEIIDIRNSWKSLVTSGVPFWQYEYYLMGWRNDAYQGVPAYYTGIIAQDLRSLKDISMGDYIEVFPSPANYLNAYVTAQLYWGVDQDPETILNEFTTLYYGPAASKMKSFIDYSEKNWKQIPQSKEEIDKVFAMIHDAKKTAGDTVYGQRVQLMIDYMAPMEKRKGQLDQSRENIQTVTAKTIESPLKLDGKLDDAFWQNQPALPMSTVIEKDGSNAGVKPSVNTTVKLGWRDGSLWMGIHCNEPLMDKVNIGMTKDGDANWFHYDGVEVMIETPRVSHYQMGISPSGAITDLSRMGKFEYEWNSESSIKTHIGKDFYSIEIRIPAGGEDRYELEPLNGVAGGKPTAAKPWFINVGRLRLVAGERETLSLTSHGFHDKLRYFQLVTSEK